MLYMNDGEAQWRAVEHRKQVEHYLAETTMSRDLPPSLPFGRLVKDWVLALLPGPRSQPTTCC